MSPPVTQLLSRTIARIATAGSLVSRNSVVTRSVWSSQLYKPAAVLRKPIWRSHATMTPSQTSNGANGSARAPYLLATEQGVTDMMQGSEAWLLASPRGAYTTARTFDCNSVFDLSFHIQRLVDSARLMMKADELAAAEDSSAVGATQDVTALERVSPQVMEALRQGISAYLEQHDDHEGELKLTMLLTWDNSSSSVQVHISPLPGRPLPPVKAQVRGAPRSNAEAKDSEWVRQRQGLVASKPQDVNELLLADADGTILEGLSSNFFVIMGGALHTAGEGILPGTVRDLALQICAREGIPVVLTAPNLKDLEIWEGAAVSSTSRLLLPLEEVSLPASDSAGERQTTYGTQPLMRRLETLVLQEIKANSEPVLSAAALTAAVSL